MVGVEAVIQRILGWRITKVNIGASATSIPCSRRKTSPLATTSVLQLGQWTRLNHLSGSFILTECHVAPGHVSRVPPEVLCLSRFGQMPKCDNGGRTSGM